MSDTDDGRAAIHRPLCPEGRAARGLAADAQPCPQDARPFVLAATILASAMAFIDGTVVTIALPAIQADFSTSFGALQWVAHAYTLLLGGLILVGGGLGDRIGRRLVFVIGIVLFAVASLACAAAPTVELLIAARALQGIGAALLVPQSLAIIAANFPKSVRGRAVGIWAGASAITTSLGPPIGGLMIDVLDWRAVFWINVPLSVVALWLTVRYVPESRGVAADGGRPGGLDWAGGLTAIVSFGALTWGLTQLSEAEIAVSFSAVLIGCGLAGLVAFVMIERRACDPLMPPGLFADPQFLGANLLTLFLYGALGGVLFLLPFDLIARREMSAGAVGLVMLPLGLIIGVLSRFTGRWADVQGPRMPLVVGSAVVAASAGLLALGGGDLWLGVVAPVMTLAVGMAIVVAPLTTAVINAAPDAQSGAASGVNNAASRLAGLFSVAILGAVASLVYAGDPGVAAALSGQEIRFGALPPSGDPARAVLETAFASAYAAAMMGAALCAAAATVIALLMIGPAEREADGAATVLVD